MMTLLYDLRFAFRTYVKNPGFTLVVVMTLALGIGANSAIFSVLNAAVLRPLPYKNPNQLVMVNTYFPTMQPDPFRMSAPEFLEYKEMTSSYNALAALAGNVVSVAGNAEPIQALAMYATADIFPVLGIEPMLGSVFTEAEDLPGDESNVVVLSYELWKRAFGGEAGLIGQTIIINATPHTVFGIMPPKHDLLELDIELWLPMGFDPDNLGSRGGHNYRVVGRLHDGLDIRQANAELSGIYERWDEVAANQHHPASSDERMHPMEIHSLKVVAIGDTRPAMFMLLGIVGFILLIACANVANLLLARAESRQKELAVRLALGAPRWRMIRQLLTESIALATMGGVVGLIMAYWILQVMLMFIPEQIPRVAEVTIDLSVLVFTLLVALGTGVLFGLAPLMRINMPKLHHALKSGGGRNSDGAERHRFRNLLVISEIALALVLITGAGLMIRSFSRLNGVDPGFDPHGVLTLDLTLPRASYPENQQVTQFFEELITRTRSLPGVTSVAVARGLPPKRNPNYNSHNIESLLLADPDGPTPNFDFMQIASADYFQVLGMTLVEGKLFTDLDTAETEGVLVINQALAQKYWPDRSPIGDRISDWSPEPNWLRIIGVVADAKQGGMEKEVGSEYFIPHRQIPKFGFAPRAMSLIVKTEGDPLAQAEPIRRIVIEMDSTLPIANITTMDQAVYDSIASQRFMTMLLSAFGILAACLATVGIYSVMAFSVAQRTNEFGIRMALGAERKDVMRNVLIQGGTLAMIGIGFGLVMTFILARLLTLRLNDILFDLSPYDPVTLIGVSLLLITTAIVACVIPARRATRVDPMVALRYE